MEADYLLKYNGGKNIEKSDPVKFIKDFLEVTNAYYKNSNVSLSRTPYYGVSISPKIKNLKVNNKSVDRVIEYTYKDKLFYIWYFYDLKIDPHNIEVRW